MRRVSAFVLAGAILISLCGCGKGNGVGPLSISFTTSAGSVPGGTQFVFIVTTQNDTQNRGVNFTLAINEPSNNETTTPCTAACGSISGPTNVVVANGPTTYTTTTSVTYSAPLLPPNPNALILTATANANSSLTTTNVFSIGAPQIVVRITNKITDIEPGAAPVTLNAEVEFDTTNAGVTWALAAQGSPCSPACGTLSNPQPFSVVYTPPAVVPAAPFNTPTITATSVANTAISDFDDIDIESATLPISVSITNPFTQITAGTAGVTIDAQVTNDIANQGVTWSISPSADTGTLSAEQPLSVIYTPPNTAPQPPNNAPTITATSVADSTKSASFTFTIEPSQAAFVGPFAFVIRGHDDSGDTMAAAGSLTSDGAGKITTGELDVNSSDALVPQTFVPLSGSYTTSKDSDGGEIVHVVLDRTPLTHYLSDLSFDAKFAPAPSTKSVPVVDFSKATISSPAAQISGQIVHQDLSAAVITNFLGHEFSLTLSPEGSAFLPVSPPPDENGGRITVSRNGAITEGELRISGSARGQAYGAGGEITGGNLSPFDTEGRATLFLSAGPRFPLHFAVYAISPTSLILLNTDIDLPPAHTGEAVRVR